METRMTRASIWDMDGTLVDTAEFHFQAWQEACRQQGLEITRAEFTATFGQRNKEIIACLFGDRLSPSEAEALDERKEELYRAAAGKGVTLLPGVRELLEALHQEGFRQAIGSSAPRANLALIVKCTGVGRFFDTVVSLEDTTRGKPDPQVFLTAAQRLATSPERCVVFEDAVAGVQAARAGGMRCVAVNFVGHHSEEALRQAGADVVVRTLEEVDAAQIVRLIG
jgi:beta-phosphoglucomutase